MVRGRDARTQDFRLFMLEEFIRSNRAIILSRAQARVGSRVSPRSGDAELKNGIPVFLDQLCEALRRAKTNEVVDHEQLGVSAGLHGQDLFRIGLTIGQVVHDYGDVCQTITELVVETNASIHGEEFKTLNLCLDDATAEAVTEYSRLRELSIGELGMERLGILGHELRRTLNTAMLSFESIKNGRVAPGGSTGMLHERCLRNLRDLIDRSLADVRLDVGLGIIQPISVAEFVEAVEIGHLAEAEARGIHFTVTVVDHDVIVEGDREILAAALSNLLQNAFKFTRKESDVSLMVRVAGDRVLFEVEDDCGGLPPGRAEDLLRPFEQRGLDRTGLGLGLSICVKAAKASGGELRVRDLPGKGCVFTLDLPKQRAPHSPVSNRAPSGDPTTSKG
jgi:signal transduction histidine kinase